MRNHAWGLLLGKATPVDAIFVQLVEKWSILKVKLDVMEKPFSFDERRYHEVGTPRLGNLRYLQTMEFILR